MMNLSYPQRHPGRPWFDAFLFLAVCISAYSIHGDAATSPGTQNVAISKAAFEPREITVARGTKVLWTNHDEMPHTVTGRDKSFASKGLDTDDSFEHTFEHEGDFEYYCTVHPYMTGVVHVRR